MTERWVKMVADETNKTAYGYLKPNDVVTLLSRQHQAFVRAVKRIHQGEHVPEYRRMEAESYSQGYLDCAGDILAALAKLGGRYGH